MGHNIDSKYKLWCQPFIWKCAIDSGLHSNFNCKPCCSNLRSFVRSRRDSSFNWPVGHGIPLDSWLWLQCHLTNIRLDYSCRCLWLYHSGWRYRAEDQCGYQQLCWRWYLRSFPLKHDRSRFSVVRPNNLIQRNRNYLPCYNISRSRWLEYANLYDWGSF